MLVLTDDALNIYSVAAKKVKFVASVAWQTDDFVHMVREILVNDCGKAPAVILNDMVEQHYRKERLPKVGFLDKASVLQRRLQVAFPSYPIRAALESKQKNFSASDKVSGAANEGGLYLFAALPTSEAFDKTLMAVRASFVTLSGVGLLPVESAAMVSKLAVSVGGEEKGRIHWSIFIGQHQNGGLRQVITRNGELALTRMTAIAGKDIDAGSWAKDVTSELKSTMSYLSRFGYHSDDILDVIIVSDSDAEKHLKAMIEIPCRLHILHPQEAAQELGIKIDSQDNDRYADAIHAAWSAGKSKLSLPMGAQQITSIEKPQRVALFAIMLLGAGAVYMGYQLVTGGQALLSARSEISDKQTALKQAEDDYQREVARKDALGYDVELIQNTMAIYDELSDGRVKPIAVINGVSRGLGNTLKLDAFRISEHIDTGPRGNNNDGEAQIQRHKALLQLSFKASIDPEKAVAEVNDLRDRLARSLPDMDVSISKQAFNMDTSTAFIGETEIFANEDIERADVTAEITIIGVML